MKKKYDVDMNDKISRLTKFKYHPNIYDKEKVLVGVRFGENRCLHCGSTDCM